LSLLLLQSGQQLNRHVAVMYNQDVSSCSSIKALPALHVEHDNNSSGVSNSTLMSFHQNISSWGSRPFLRTWHAQQQQLSCQQLNRHVALMSYNQDVSSCSSIEALPALHVEHDNNSSGVSNSTLMSFNQNISSWGSRPFLHT
jgi:hypothetical protein